MPVFLPLVSEAFAKNDNLTIFDRFDGKISDHVKTMISDEKYSLNEELPELYSSIKTV